MLIGLLADTHAVFDTQLATALQGVELLLHAGDVGHHGGTAEVLEHLRSLCPAVKAVAGNTDDGPGAKSVALPACEVIDCQGWRLLLTHVVGSPTKVDPSAQALISQHAPDIVVYGHSHVKHHSTHQGVLYINPGSAGPARFKLGRSVALLQLPRRDSGEAPKVTFVPLAPKAPPRLTCKQGRQETKQANTSQLQQQGKQRQHPVPDAGEGGGGGGVEEEAAGVAGGSGRAGRGKRGRDAGQSVQEGLQVGSDGKQGLGHARAVRRKR